MKSIFLSASVPSRDRDPKYYESADVMAIRDSVLALVDCCLRNEMRIVWGGHPAITPLIYQAINQYMSEEDSSDFHKVDKETVQKFMIIYQSEHYKKFFPKDNEFFQNIRFTPDLGEKKASNDRMREEMLGAADFAAAVFIGGMEGVEEEYSLFSEKHPDVPCLPIASTGAASEIIYEKDKESRNYCADLIDNYAYSALFQKYLIR